MKAPRTGNLFFAGHGEQAALSIVNGDSKPHRLAVQALIVDWDNQPRPFKVYLDLDPIPLPTELPGSQRLAIDAIAGAPAPAASPLDLAHLAHLLYFSAGIVRRRTHPGGEIFYRAAACTGN